MLVRFTFWRLSYLFSILQACFSSRSSIFVTSVSVSLVSHFFHFNEFSLGTLQRLQHEENKLAYYNKILDGKNRQTDRQTTDKQTNGQDY